MGISTMKTIKVSEANILQLDWLVAKAHYTDGRKTQVYRSYITVENFPGSGGFFSYGPTTDWSQGGPIIEREKIQLSFGVGINSDLWFAERYRCYAGGRDVKSQQYGKAPLIAAMRCYIASKLGETAEVPEEL